MTLTTTDATTDEPLSLEEAKRHLRRLDGDLDDEIEALITVAREYCEKFTRRTLRSSVTRELTYSDWWRNELWLPWPPLVPVVGEVNPVTITYTDADGDSQTLDADSYQIITDTDGGSRLVWLSGATIPNLASATNAITIEFETGYPDGPPAIAKQAMKLRLEVEFGTGTPQHLELCAKRADNLLGMIDWSGYS